MELVNSYNKNNSLSVTSSIGGSFGYDIEDEKKRLSDGYADVVNDLAEKWKKTYAGEQIFPAVIEAMHPEVVDFLLSFNLVSVYDDIAKRANLDARSRNFLPKIIWRIAQEKKWNEFEVLLEANLNLTHSLHVQVADFLHQNIIDKIRVISEKPFTKKTAPVEFSEKKQLKLSLEQALSQYPNLEQQHVTANQLRLRDAAVPMKPSIRNWIADFHASMGAGKHSPIDRGNFLFHSENGKSLSATDRQRLGAILKSLDEQTLLTIDPISQAIVFEIEQVSPMPIRQQVASQAIQPKVDRITSEIFSDINSRKIQQEVPAFAKPAPVVAPPVASQEKKPIFEMPRREVFSDVNLKQNQQPVLNGESVQISRVSEVKNNNVQKDVLLNINLSQNQSQPQVVVPKKETAVTSFFESSRHDEKNEKLFQIPQSKPPIGSDEYNIEKVVNEKKIEAPKQVAAVIEKPAIAKLKDVNDLSDDEILTRFLERKNKEGDDGKIKFSSPQVFSVEQRAKSAQPKQEQQVQPQEKPKQDQPVTQKNTVNLRSL